MCEKSMLEELCSIISEKAMPSSDSYRQNLSRASQARQKLGETLTPEQKKLLEERDDALGECRCEEELESFRIIFSLACEITRGTGSII